MHKGKVLAQGLLALSGAALSVPTIVVGLLFILDAVLGRLPNVGREAAVPQSDGVRTGSERVGPKHHRGTAMEHYAGIDVSLEQSSVCVVDTKGQIVREAKVASEPEALVGFFGRLGVPLTRIGLEAGPLSQWLHAGLSEAGLDAVLLETRHVKAALSAMTVKTDRKDARGIAQLLRMGWFRPVHRKSPDAQEVRALLVGRKLLQSKLRDVELSIRGILRGFGLKVGEVSKGRFAARIEELIAGQAMLETVIGAMLMAREGLQAEFLRLHKRMLAIVRADAVCRRLMTVPGVGALVAITFRTAVDDPTRFGRSKAVGAHFGLTPKKYQSGETDVTGGISKVGDAMVRTALYEAANAMLSRPTRFSTLKRWAMQVAKRRGLKRAKVALARKLALVLHRMWADGTEFHWGKEVAAG
jgi:transposase